MQNLWTAQFRAQSLSVYRGKPVSDGRNLDEPPDMYTPIGRFAVKMKKKGEKAIDFVMFLWQYYIGRKKSGLYMQYIKKDGSIRFTYLNAKIYDNGILLQPNPGFGKAMFLEEEENQSPNFQELVQKLEELGVQKEKFTTYNLLNGRETIDVQKRGEAREKEESEISAMTIRCRQLQQNESDRQKVQHICGNLRTDTNFEQFMRSLDEALKKE